MKLTAAIQQRTRKWFGSRMPVGDKVRLSQNSSYIWPTKSGYMLSAIVILMLIGATNYQNNLAFMLSFLLVGVGLVTIIYTYKNLQNIEFCEGQPSELFAKQSGVMAITLNSHNDESHASIGIGWDSGYKKGIENLIYVDVPEHGLTNVNLTFTPNKRGKQKLPRIMVSSVFPFGWFRTWAYFGLAREVLVFPQPLEPPQRFEVSGGDEMESEQGKRTVGNEDFYGLKSYQPGESMSRIDWKSFARERGLHVREFASVQGNELSFRWEEFEGFPDEARVSFLAYMVLQASHQNLAYSLSLPGQHIGFDEGDIHRRNCLSALALFNIKHVE